MRDLAGSLAEQRGGQGAEGCVKTASDLARYRRVLAEVRPAWVVETGTFSGVSACWFADVAGCRVATIDTHPQVAPEVHRHLGIYWFHGSSIDPKFVADIHGLVGTAVPVLVVLDSSHVAAHVHAEMEAYAPLVTPGSYMVVEDGIVRWLPEQLVVYGDSSPLDAIERFVADHADDWVIDADVEDMLPTTQFPSGWLRRVA